jgi:hypothetical protein
MRSARVNAVAAVVMLVLSAGCQPGIRDGPLAIDDGRGAVVGFQAREGQRVAYGFTVVTNQGDGRITNIAISLVPTGDASSPGVSFEPAQVVDLGAHDEVSLAAGPWPYEKWGQVAIPLERYVLPAKSGRVELLIVMTVRATGQWFWPRTRVEYDFEGRRYAEEVDNGFAVCAPAPCTNRHK